MFSALADISKTVRSLRIKAGRRHYADMLDLDPIAVICSFKKDALFLRGGRNDLASIADSQKAGRTCSSARLILFPAAGHGFYGAVRDRAQKAAIDCAFSHTAAKPPR